MTKLTPDSWMQARNWMFRNARPLELARWKYHFEQGNKEDVLSALEVYQNEDGGFGNELEPDSWNPNSSPYSTSMAICILEEINFRDSSHPIIEGILRYSEHTPHFTGKSWPAVIPSNNDYPHAPWWTYSGNDLETRWGYTPTAILAGFILRFADQDSSLYEKAAQIAKTAIDCYLHGTTADGEPYRSLHREGEIEGFHLLLTCLEEGGPRDLGDISALKTALKSQADRFIVRDPSMWKQYCRRPSTYIASPGSLFLTDNEKDMDADLSFMVDGRNEDGVWDISWSWGAYEKEFAVSENWWKGIKALEYMLLLKNFNRLEGESPC
ncbi:hypothetical protein [Fontibacillus sp. BL9]|uniref:hypothetical protein n=1 Tax=Fontibacillus sp. BL9 TaxID=3389971 RepID=UPI00397DB12F